MALSVAFRNTRRRDLLEIVEDRHSIRSTIIVTQLPIDASASDIIKALDLDPKTYQTISWCWWEEPTNISGIAVMTDTDNTGETATASYADLVLK